MPYIDVGACPGGEGCVGYGRTRARARMVAYEGTPEHYPGQPPPFGAVRLTVAFEIAPGEAIHAVTGVVVTTKPRAVRFTRRYVTEASFLSLPAEPARPLTFEPGDVAYLLTNYGELRYAAWVRGQLYESVEMANLREPNLACPPAANCVGELIHEGEHEWWVYVRTARGQEGWVRNPSYEPTRSGR